jgi:cell division transport system permease protein
MTTISNYLLRHLQVFFYSLGQMALSPFATFMTTAVLGVALALPVGMFVLLSNMESVLSSWDGQARIEIYLKLGMTEKQSRQFGAAIRKRPEVSQVDYISADTALVEFRKSSGFGKALDELEKNPLPHTLLVRPTEQFSEPQQLQQMMTEYSKLSEVENAKIDLDWVQRLHAISKLLRRGVILLSALLALAILLVISNTIRLAILNRQSEIKVMKLVGATNRFIRRPFLYTGLWYGILGGLFAWATLLMMMLLLSEPVNELTRRYSSDFTLQWFTALLLFILPAVGTLLGIAGAWLAVGRHLDAIEPN